MKQIHHPLMQINLYYFSDLECFQQQPLESKFVIPVKKYQNRKTKLILKDDINLLILYTYSHKTVYYSRLKEAYY